MHPVEESIKSGWGVTTQWFAMLGAPIVMFLHGAICFVMLPWACGAGQQIAMWITTGICILVMTAPIATAYKIWLQTGANWQDTEQSGIIPRARFMAIVAMAVGTLSLCVSLGIAVAITFLGVCQ